MVGAQSQHENETFRLGLVLWTFSKAYMYAPCQNAYTPTKWSPSPSYLAPYLIPLETGPRRCSFVWLTKLAGQFYHDSPDALVAGDPECSVDANGRHVDGQIPIKLLPISIVRHFGISFPPESLSRRWSNSNKYAEALFAISRDFPWSTQLLCVYTRLERTDSRTICSSAGHTLLCK